MKVLVYIETKEGAPVPGSLELLTAAKELGETVAVAVEDKAAAEKAAAYGAKVTVLKTGEASEDAQTAALESYIREVQPELVLFSGTQLGKDLAPRLAQRFDAGCVTDVTVIDKTDSGLEFVRPAYGGTILERLFVSGPIRFATVRSGSFEKPEAAEGSVEEKDMPFAEDILKAKVLDAAKEITEAIDLEGADVIVTGGRGMGDAEGFKLVEELGSTVRRCGRSVPSGHRGRLGIPCSPGRPVRQDRCAEALHCLRCIRSHAACIRYHGIQIYCSHQQG